MNPIKPKKYWGFIIMMSTAIFLFIFAILDLVFNTEVTYVLESLVMLSHVPHLNFTHAWFNIKIFQMFTRLIPLFLCSTEFHQLTDALKYFWRFENHQHLKDKIHRKLNIIHLGAKVYFYFTAGGFLIAIILTIFSYRYLMIYVYVPEILGRYFFLVLENVLIPLITVTVISFDYLILTFMQLTTIQFRILHAEISKLHFGQDQHQSNLKSQFTKIIKHHIFLLEFADKLKQIISLPFLFQYFTTVMAICMELYVSRKK